MTPHGDGRYRVVVPPCVRYPPGEVFMDMDTGMVPQRGRQTPPPRESEDLADISG